MSPVLPTTSILTVVFLSVALPSVNSITGEGLASALKDASVVVDVTTLTRATTASR
jgi:hypothetical protein